MALTDMEHSEKVALSDEHLTNAVLNHLLSPLEEAGFLEGRFPSEGGGTVQRVLIAGREVHVTVEVS